MGTQLRLNHSVGKTLPLLWSYPARIWINRRLIQCLDTTLFNKNIYIYIYIFIQFIFYLYPIYNIFHFYMFKYNEKSNSIISCIRSKWLGRVCIVKTVEAKNINHIKSAASLLAWSCCQFSYLYFCFIWNKIVYLTLGARDK